MSFHSQVFETEFYGDNDDSNLTRSWKRSKGDKGEIAGTRGDEIENGGIIGVTHAAKDIGAEIFAI